MSPIRRWSDARRRLGRWVWGMGLLCLGLLWLVAPPVLAGTLGPPMGDRLRTSATLDPTHTFPRAKVARQGKASPISLARPLLSDDPPGIHGRSVIPHPAVVRVIVPEQGAISYGSGTLVDVRDQFGMVITNWHVVRDAQGDVEVLFPDGFRSKARALKVDADWDLAALVIWRPSVSPVPLATAAPRPGDQLTICGYGQGSYRAVTGRCTQYYAPREDFPQHMVELDVEARQGDSGGPIFNQHGQMAGVLFGAGQGTTLGSFGGRVQSFLATLAPDIGRRADDALLQAATPHPGLDSTKRSAMNRGSTSPGSTNGELAGSASHPAHSMANQLAEGDRSQGRNRDEVWRPVEPPGGQHEDVAANTSSANGTGLPVLAEEVSAWRALAGVGWYEQVKSALAAIGLLAIVGGVLRAAR